MTKVRADGGPADWRLTETVLAGHSKYLGAIIRLFDAVDQHRPVKVAYLDRTQADRRGGRQCWGNLNRACPREARKRITRRAAGSASGGQQKVEGRAARALEIS